MGGKRKKNEDEGSSLEHSALTSTSTSKLVFPSMIKNKEKRSAVHAKLKHQKKVEKRKKAKAREAAEKRALELGEEVPFLMKTLNLIIHFFFALGRTK